MAAQRPNATGTLTFATNVTFASGGAYAWTLQDTARPDGWSLLAISGDLSITATSGGFTLDLLSYDGTCTPRMPDNFNPSLPCAWGIAVAGGTIQSFSPSAFTIDASGFANGSLDSGHFSLAVDGTNQLLLLNFTLVPEPSTWLLLLAGLGALPVILRRRGRA